MSITGAQIRAARQLLGWTQRQMARMSGVSIGTVSKIESGLPASEHLMAKVGIALLDAGIEFTVGQRPGVRLHPKKRKCARTSSGSGKRSSIGRQFG